MRGISDIFISKDKVAMFWFIVTCATLAGTAWYLKSLADEGRTRMLYVPMTREGVIEIDPAMDEDTTNELLDYQTRIALETLLNRGPSGPVNSSRISKIFIDGALEWVMKDIQASLFDFRDKQRRQMVELGASDVRISDDGSATVSITGQVVSVSVDPLEQRIVNQVHTVTATVSWVKNKHLRDSKLFPYVSEKVVYLMTLVSDS
jgi:hypothetical protein